ncbi:MAG: protein tyrosine phosphatase family protein [Burkholderiales bacterium]|nr:protein tyrosine phosphatase family protein [Burkholderiales bacterium]
MRRRTLVMGAAALLPLAAHAQALDAPNVIPISPLLVTSGQPPEQALKRLSAYGFQAVVYLAPGNVSTAVPAEAGLLAAQGIEFVHIPIPFGSPDASHLQAFYAALDRLKDRKVLVHCEINMRASALVFLYRTVQLREDPDNAYESVIRIWSPRGVWRRLVVQELAAHHIAFEPY